MKNNRKYTIFIIPFIFIYGSFFVLPTFLSIPFSLSHWDLTNFKFVGFENFLIVINESSLIKSIINTFYFAITSCMGKVILGFILANFINKLTISKKFILSLVYIPHLLNPLSIGIIFTAVLYPTNGPISLLLQTIGFGKFNWLSNNFIAMSVIVFVDVWKDIGIAVIIYLAALQSIPENIIEAAQLDQCNNWSIMKYIIIPHCIPSIITIMLLSFVGGFKTFDIVWAMTKGGPGNSTDVLSSLIYKQYAGGYYGISSAGNVIMLLLVVIIIIPFLKKIQHKGVYNFERK